MATDDQCLQIVTQIDAFVLLLSKFQFSRAPSSEFRIPSSEFRVPHHSRSIYVVGEWELEVGAGGGVRLSTRVAG